MARDPYPVCHNDDGGARDYITRSRPLARFQCLLHQDSNVCTRSLHEHIIVLALYDRRN